MTPYFVILALLIALAPAFIAHGKGRNFLFWWLYGVVLGPVALIHSILLRNPRRPALEDPLYEDESSWSSPWPLLLRVAASLAIAVVAVALYRLFVPPEFDMGSGSREVAVSTDRTAPGQRVAPAPSAGEPSPAEAKAEKPKPSPAPSPTVNVTVREDTPPTAAKNGEREPPPAAPAAEEPPSKQAAAPAASESKPESKPTPETSARDDSKPAPAKTSRAAAESEIVPPPPPPPSPASASTERLERTGPASTLERTVAKKAAPEAAPAKEPAAAEKKTDGDNKTDGDKKTDGDSSAAKDVKTLAARTAPPESAAPSPPDPVIAAPAPRGEMLRGETEAQPARRKPASRKASTPAPASTPSPAPPASDVTAVGDIVRMVQQALVERGYDPGPVNGRAGRETEQAIRKFQEDRGLNPTGSIDYTVLETLNIVGPRVHAFQPPPGTAPGR